MQERLTKEREEAQTILKSLQEQLDATNAALEATAMDGNGTGGEEMKKLTKELKEEKKKVRQQPRLQSH